MKPAHKPNQVPPSDARVLPPRAPPEVGAALAAGETLIACFEPDLDQRLHFVPGLVCLTERRLLSANGGEWDSWPLESLTGLRAVEQGAAGTLEALGPNERLAHWRYTAARSSAAQHFAERGRAAIRRRVQAETGNEQVLGTVCPTCGATIEPDQDGCPFCSAPPLPPPGRSLWRLTRFARPRAGLIALGFGLMLAGTAASLVPPYLTMP
jgi:ATP-binding cassette subfamily B protein